MTINDLYINERCTLIRRQAEELQKLMRDGRERDLFIALSNIEREARQAQEHLNEALYRK